MLYSDAIWLRLLMSRILQMKKMFLKLLAISSIALTNVSFADSYDWSGMSLGGGLGVGQLDSKLENRTVGAQHYFYANGDSVDLKASSALGFGGIYIGVQKQYNNFLFGVELDYALSSFEDSKQQASLYDTNNYEVKINNIASLSGKVGYAFDNNLIYGRLGYITAKISTQSEEPLFQHIGTSSERHSGYLIGIGYDRALNENVTLGINYNHYKFNDKTQSGQDLSNFIPTYEVNLGPSLDTLMFKLSYKFNLINN